MNAPKQILTISPTEYQLMCQQCIAFDQKAYIDGLQTGAHLINKLFKEDK